MGVDGTGSGPCPVAGSGVSNVTPAGKQSMSSPCLEPGIP
jgi:hypothetical protein